MIYNGIKVLKVEIEFERNPRYEVQSIESVIEEDFHPVRIRRCVFEPEGAK